MIDPENRVSGVPNVVGKNCDPNATCAPLELHRYIR